MQIDCEPVLRSIEVVKPDHLVIIGGTSRAGRAIIARTDAPIISVVREPTGRPGEVVVTAYDRPPDDMELAGAAIVNCAGTPIGSREELHRANVAVPMAWARQAQGCARFVQISSFSIFGPVPLVTAATPLAPTTDYGSSKAAAEAALAGSGLGDRLTVLRVPILIGGDRDKLAQLIRLVRRTGIVPAAPWPTPRSMLSYDGLAAAILGMIADDRGGTFSAADPEPFTPEMVARVSGGARVMRVPAMPLSLVRRALPGLHASMFRPNLLSPEDNVAQGYLPFERVDDVVRQLLGTQARA